ncbi:MAG TPA: YigZ family protein [Bacillota bacterium]|jgi:uncharacterized YigZ family protein|nr:YigZ family protein [Bacillota bacterium]HOL09186.1 YigZ family protein [Bacillota bacterium]HPO96861.1 YigZ family protein [Bacillota bacterium]
MTMNTLPYITIASPASIEITIERSRFIGHCQPATTETAAKEFVYQIRQTHSQASHNCFAYRIGEPNNIQEYFNDHGEPSGTAGKPILGAIQRIKATNTVVVVTRYFGGKKLGVRGLIEAYGQTATLVLEKAGVITVTPKTRVCLEYPYSEHSMMLYQLNQIEAELLDTIYSHNIALQIAVPNTSWSLFLDLLKNFPNINYKIDD